MFQHSRFRFAALCALSLFCSSEAAFGQLRIINYNTAGVNNSAAMTTAITAMNAFSDNGVVKPIDVLILQELGGASDVTAMLNILNGQSLGTYVAGSLGSTTGAGSVGLIYRAESVDLIHQQQVVNTSSSGAARGVMRYTLRPDGYDDAADFYIYGSHYKSADSSTDRARRNVEATAIRANADALLQGAHIIYAGDFNIYRASEPMWTTLTGGGNGQAFDPVDEIGEWHDDPNFIPVHTQNPAGSGLVGGGMDDRFDWQMVTEELMDDEGMAILDGSYHAFGNNGTHAINGHINTGTGASATVLNALGSASDHLPIFAQYQVPAKMDVAVASVPGQVIVGATLQAEITVANSAGDGNIVVDAVGADELDYTIDASGDASGSQNGSDEAFGADIAHYFALDTSLAGAKSASFDTSATSPQVPSPARNNVVEYDVLDHATPSFSGGSQVSSLTYDFGALPIGAPLPSFNFDLFNLEGTAGYTASLELDSIVPSGDFSQFPSDLTTFGGLSALGAGLSESFTAMLDTSLPGSFSATYTLSFSDENLLGALNLGSLTLTLTGTVGVPEPAAAALALGALVVASWCRGRRQRQLPIC